LSDIDLRAYFDSWIEDEARCHSIKQQIKDKIQAWHQIGVEIDGYWPRRIPDIESRLNAIRSGENFDPDPCLWTIWGYYLPTDIANNTIIEDPFQILSNWKDQLQTYPQNLKNAVIKKHLASALYWRNDYHYINKVQRADTVFCSGLANLLVHDLIQIIFALNHTYYSGDGWNLAYIKTFTKVPVDFTREVEKALLVHDPHEFGEQRAALCRLIDQVEQLVKDCSLDSHDQRI
jgi:hypothetical protein